MTYSVRRNPASNYYKSLLWLIYVSMAIIIIDAVFGIDVFLTDSERLSTLYRLAFLFKILLVVLSICFFSKIPKNLGFILLILILTAKLLLGIYFISSIKALFGHIQFYLFIIFGYISGWQIARSDISRIAVSKNFFKIVVGMTVILCTLYFSAYQAGIITYFGLGLQTFILVSVYIATKPSRFYGILVFATVILTGKRSSFLIYLGQIFGPKMLSRKVSIAGIFTGTIFFAAFLYITYQVGLAERFQGLLELFREFDRGDFEKNRELFYYATGGRTEEFYGFFVDQEQSLYALLMGKLAGHTYDITSMAGYDYTRYYFHISPLNFIFHFGFPLGILIILIQLRVFFWALHYVSKEQDIFCLLFIGYYLTSLFGAVIVMDILYWVLFFYCYFLQQTIKNKKRYYA